MYFFVVVQRVKKIFWRKFHGRGSRVTVYDRWEKFAGSNTTNLSQSPFRFRYFRQRNKIKYVNLIFAQFFISGSGNSSAKITVSRTNDQWNLKFFTQFIHFSDQRRYSAEFVKILITSQFIKTRKNYYCDPSAVLFAGRELTVYVPSGSVCASGRTRQSGRLHLAAGTARY